MRMFQTLICATICLGLLVANALAAPKQRTELFRFENTYKVPITERHRVTPLRPRVKSWTADEKRRVLAALKAVQKTFPGLVMKATAYRPLRLYRIPTIGGGLVMAVLTHNGLLVSDDFFRTKNLFPMMVHELAHLADGSKKLINREAWKRLVGPRIERIKARLNDELGLTLYRAVWITKPKTDIAIQEGLPTLYAAGNFGEALGVTVERMVAKTFDPPPRIKAFINSKLLSPSFEPDDSVRQFHFALALLEQDRLNDAIQAFDRAIRLDGKFAFAYAQRALAMIAKGDLGKAISDLTQAIKLRDDGVKFHIIRRGNLWLQQRNRDRAIADFTEATKLHPKNGQAFLRRGYAWLIGRDHDKAIADFDEVIKLKPKSEMAYYFRAWAWLGKNNLDKAEADASITIKLAPKSWWPPYFLRARVRQRAKNCKAALSDYDAVIRLNTKHAQAYMNRAACRERLKDIGGAIADYTAAIRIIPKNKIARRNRAYANWRRGQYDKAIADFTRLKQLYPSNTKIWDGFIRNIELERRRKKESR